MTCLLIFTALFVAGKLKKMRQGGKCRNPPENMHIYKIEKLHILKSDSHLTEDI